MNVLDSSQQLDLVTRLAALTTSGRLDWTLDPRDRFAAYASTDHFRLRLTCMDDDDLPPILIDLMTADSETDQPLQRIETDITPQGATPTQLNLRLMKLYELVMRRLRGVDNAAEQLFSDLDRLDQP